MPVRKLLLLCLLPCLCVGQHRYYDTYGGQDSFGFSAATFAVDASNDQLAFSWIPTRSVAISKVVVYASAVNGTLGTNDLVCTIYSDNAGQPNVSQEARNTVTAVPTGAAAVEFTGFTFSTTAGTKIWFVLSNANGTPGTNYPTYRYGISSNHGGVMTGGLGPVASQTAGGAWTGAAAGNFPFLRIEYTGSVYEGYPITGVLTASNVASSYRVYGTRENGATFTAPANASLKVIGVALYMNKAGAPTGNIAVKLYSESGATDTLQATSRAHTPGMIYTVQVPVQFMFSSSVALTPGVKYRVALFDSVADTSGNYYVASGSSNMSDSASLALLPFEGTLRGCYCGGTCTTASNWTDGDGSYTPQITLLLDPAGGFASLGAGGGQKAKAYQK